MAIPDFRDDGYLPLGLHKATEQDVAERFGTSSEQRVDLMLRVSKWLGFARVVGAQRFLVDGSFVTAKDEPNDVDCACWLPRDFRQQYEWGRYEAFALQESMYRGEPKEIYPCQSSGEWDWWVLFFSRTRELDGRHKGIIEVIL